MRDDSAELEVYERAVRARQIKVKLRGTAFAGYDEHLRDYLHEIVKRATGKDVDPVKAIPRVRIPGEEG